jgi:hypothetical protein
MIGSSTLMPFIKSCGYLEFYKEISTDNRGVFLELSFEIIDALTRLQRARSRHLNSAFQKDVSKYKQFVHQEFESHNIPKRAAALYMAHRPMVPSWTAIIWTSLTPSTL